MPWLYTLGSCATLGGKGPVSGHRHGLGEPPEQQPPRHRAVLARGRGGERQPGGGEQLEDPRLLERLLLGQRGRRLSLLLGHSSGTCSSFWFLKLASC